MPVKSHTQPVVAIVGHIDHGKTTLLDSIRKTDTAAREAGGITQKVSAYEISHETPEGKRAITFIDTPGHEAFQKMRLRGAAAADIAILVVAADDGVKPQTKEAYKAIQEAKVPFIVAFTKVDKDTANIERAKESVMKEGIYLEGLGGEVPFAKVSGKTGEGIPELLDLILLAADLHDIACDPGKPAQAIVIESTRDARTGVSATVIVKEGTFSVGGFAIAGSAYAPIRALEDFTGAKVKEIACGKPARISGFTDEPPVGEIVSVVSSKKEAEEAISLKKKKTNTAPLMQSPDENRSTVRLVLKADSAGSLEALEYEIAKIPAEKIDIVTVLRGIGPISEGDIKVLIGFPASIAVGFNVKIEPVAKDLAERQGVSVETRSIIYELAEWIAETIKKYTPVDVTEKALGVATILKHFSTSGSKHVVGGRVTEGALSLHDRVTIFRRGIDVGAGKITNLQRQRADVSTVPEGMEFGAQIESKADIVQGDTVTATPAVHFKK